MDVVIKKITNDEPMLGSRYYYIQSVKKNNISVISTVDIFVFIEYNNSAADKAAWLSIIDNYNNNRHLSRATVIVFFAFS